jgi:tagaturonate epimerase
MRAINRFCLDHNLRIATNPAISPDACLDWASLAAGLRAGTVPTLPQSRVETTKGAFTLAVDARGDHAWVGPEAPLAEGITLADGTRAYPATWENLLILKNLIQEHDAGSTVFPTSGGGLAQRSLGVGARFTTLHWPAVEWAMAHLNLSLVANQNSIPRELVYDVDAMLAGKLDSVPFPFIGANVPEGHQGQSVQGMSHLAVLSKLVTGFHQRRIPWGFNADHQPIGGKFDAREEALVAGALLASSITFDLSPELTATVMPADPAAWVAANVPAAILATVRTRTAAVGVALDEAQLAELLARVWPAMMKFQRRDQLYAASRAKAFTTTVGRDYVRELSIDELPGLTSRETLATMLALCEALGIRVHYVAPAFGFQKNFPFADQIELERRISAAWTICKAFDISIGFHSGSGKSAENYRLAGRITGSRLEIKTSGRYTYEMGRALHASPDAGDQALWREWYAFTRGLAVTGAFSSDETERRFARQFIVHALEYGQQATDVFASEATCAKALEALTPDPEHMFWFEYNFLFVLAAEGKAAKSALGDHSPAGYRQRARFYRISPAGRLAYARNVITYLAFLAETTGLASAAQCQTALTRLAGLSSIEALLADIAPKAQGNAGRG